MSVNDNEHGIPSQVAFFKDFVPLLNFIFCRINVAVVSLIISQLLLD